MPGPFRSILQISCCSSLDCSQNICHYYMSEEIFHCFAVIFVTFLNHETSHDWTIFIVLVRFNKAFSHKLSWITLNKLDGLFFTGRRLEHCLVIFYLKKEDLNLILDRWRSSKMSELQLDPESHKTSSSNSVDIFRHISQGTLPSNLTNKFCSQLPQLRSSNGKWTTIKSEPIQCHTSKWDHTCRSQSLTWHPRLCLIKAILESSLLSSCI